MKYLLPLILLSGCSLLQEKPPVEKLVYVTTPLYLPTRPTLPTWTYDDMNCLSDEMIQKISDRDTMRKNYTEQLELIISNTQKQNPR